ncbi:type 1 periplasmic-binding domain-containing protein [Enterovibrio coralii]|uniref:Uncharacterized protein n=1 Tax=Enterovibrio coralii TaxID=294935 RepID=A0A135IA60_9GAMM|nr:hypothetical protein [Enterovibrio coralii]KXF82340.1 hypothetical protein ATN88_09275 [Enterovibrio coralii]
MTEKDYLAWLAVKQVVAFTLRHQGSFTYAEVRQYLRDPSLKLAGYKGRPMNFRPWNQQLRQPIILTSESALISMSPIEGFLHPTFHTDTLGYDEPESACRLTDNQGELL